MARSVLEAMLAAAERAHPNEACGILLGMDGAVTAFVETLNVHPTPETHFEIDPAALIEAHKAARSGGPPVLGYFHSHPQGDARPSEIDAQLAAGDGKVWAIAGAGKLALWRSEATGFESLCLTQTGG